MSKPKRKISTKERLKTPLYAGFLIPLVFALYRLFVTSIQRMSPNHAYLLARFLGWLGWKFGGRTRLIALRNLEIAFRGSLSKEEREKIGRSSLQHFVCTLFDVYLLPAYWQSGQWREILEFTAEQEEVFEGLKNQKDGVAFQSAHIGSWEFGAGAFTKLGKPMSLIYRPLVIEEIDKDFSRYREASGATQVSKVGGLRNMARVLRKGGWVAILSDQNAGRLAPYLEFCGTVASAQNEHFAAYGRFRAKVATAFVVRDGFNFRFKLRGLSEAEFDHAADPEEEAIRLGQWYFDAVEKVIREFPDQYLWVHRRYAHRPKGAPDLYTDLKQPLDMAKLEAQPKGPTVWNPEK